MSIPVTTEGKDSKERIAEVDLMKADDVSNIGLGAKVTVTLVGEVVGLRGVEQYKYSDEDISTYPGKLKLEVDSFSVAKVSDFDGIEMEEDEG